MIAGDRPMCLGQDELERIATDAAAGGDSLAHLEHCADCRAAIDRIRAERALFNELVGAVREGNAVPQRPAAAIEIPGYTIYAELCRGGQGIVYRALQHSTRREVAVKVIRDGPFSGRADRARFEREVELLAQLEHPNIVAIHDSGMAAGFFYFVMDLVRGVTLDEFIAGRDAAQASRSRAAHGASSANRAERRLPLSRAEVTLRLRLFATICDAVNAAHLRGVIHRDLKPANVLVDERGTPHVLDFGLARAAARSDASLTITRTGFFVGTPLWAAPEQLDDQTGRSDLRSDVYSLGVMLYQMLTGAWPYGEARSLPEIVTAVRDVDPISPRRVRAGLDDDIETIILKCLEKDPARRYETAGAVARDVLRYLAGNAIDARRDSTWYVFRKSLNRHRRTVTATTLIAAALLIGGAMAVNGAIESRTAQAREGYERARVASERAKAEAITQIAREMFPTGDRNTLVSTPQFIALQNLTKRMDTGLLQGRPEVEIAVRTSIAEIYRERGLTGFSEQELRQAHRLSVLSFGQRHATTAACADVLAEMLLRRNSALEAERHCRAALDVRREVLGPEHVDVARSLETLARIELAMGRSSDALKSAANALRIRRNTFGDEHVDVAASHETIAAIRLFDGASAAASAELRIALAVRLRLLNDAHPSIVQCLLQLALALESANTSDSVMGPESLRALAAGLQVTGTEPMSLETCERMLALKRAVLPAGHADLAETLQAIGEIRYAAKDFREALGSYYEALAICEANYGPESIEAANCLNYIGGSLIELHDHEAMAEVTRRRYNIFEKRLRGTGDFSLGVYQRELSDALCRAGRHEEAEEEGRAALAYLRSILGDEHREVAWCEGIIANLLACHGKLDEAETMAIDAATRYSRLDPNGRLTPLIKRGRDFIFALRGNFDAPELAEFKSRDLDYAFLAYVQNHPASADVFQRGAEHFELHGQTEAAAEWRTVAERAAAIGSPQVSR